jgi:hypothetical protein
VRAGPVPRIKCPNSSYGVLMGGASLPRKAITAFRSAGATEEMIAGARLIFGSLPPEAPGRPRMYKNRKEADHAFYIRKRDRHRKMRAISSNKAPPPEILSPAAEQEMLERSNGTAATIVSASHIACKCDQTRCRPQAVLRFPP